MHSCGAVSQFIPLLIEMGVDALNPVQVSAAGMNPRDLAPNMARTSPSGAAAATPNMP